MIIDTKDSLRLVEDATQELLDWAVAIEQSDATYFEKAQTIVRRLGAHYRPDGLTEIGFWIPELTGEVMRQMDVYLEVLTPLEPINLRATEQIVTFYRNRLRLKQYGEYFWGVIAGMQPGSRNQVGSFYWLRYLDLQEKLRAIRDVVPYSLPYGVFGPAELYDINSLQQQRTDLGYFQRTASSEPDKIARVPAPINILQLHVGTASKEGTFEGLTRIYRQISDKLAKRIPLTPAEENYIGYDAVQLLPVEPTIEYRDEYSPESEFFSFISGQGNYLQIQLKKSITQDWGYDVPILGSSATNPAILGSLRPDEVVDFIATLHNFSSGPIQLIYDLVYGHADNQSELLLNRQFLKGPNMYGQDLNHQQPTVRAIFLEMQRRRINDGIDGIRVDGGQDFRFFNPLSGRVEQDDAYLLAMSDLVQEIGPHQRLLFTIYEDGRPWPQEGWEEISTYRDLVTLKPDSYQWGPLIFAHNTPALEKFWDKKWRRVCEVIFEGENWITGCANHDTVRRGNQIDPNGSINWHLGNTLPEVLKNAYDNPAVTLWVYGFSPGLPMDFINATMRAPWMFFRNTDERYGVKVASEEVGFLDWQITPEIYASDDQFKRLKLTGFRDLNPLQHFAKLLQKAIIETDYNLAEVVQACQSFWEEKTEGGEVLDQEQMHSPEIANFLRKLNVPRLKAFALMFMEDCYDACNVCHYHADLSPVQTQFNLTLRRFRHNHSWVRQNLQGTDRFNKISDEASTVYYGVRSNPEDSDEQVAMVAHMGGESKTITLGDWLQLDLAEWRVAIASPGLESGDNLANLECFELADSQALLLERIRETA
ncbi:glucosylglycerol hydrolase [Lyngbya aestuarii]|uniref:glucosylglycerol hydrolase n=1 Tax=Lyngbya aestuarii TaxID=118322 RepID=UPI00403D8307